MITKDDLFPIKEQVLTEAEYAELVTLLKTKNRDQFRVFELKSQASDDQLIKSHKEAGIEQYLSALDCDVSDATDGVIRDLWVSLTGEPVPDFDGRFGAFKEDVIDAIVRYSGKNEYFFYPYMVSED